MKNQTEMKRSRFILVGLGLAAALVVSPFGIFSGTSAYASQGATIQEINIQVLPPESGPNPGAPLAGVSTAQSDTELTDPMITGIALAIGLVVLIFLAYRMYLNRKKASKAPYIVPMVAVCMFMTFATLRSVNAAATDPTITLNSDVVNYTMRAGESAPVSFDATVMSDVGSAGYTLSAIANNEIDGITLELNGGSLGSATAVPTIDLEDPLLIYGSDENASDGDISNYIMTANIGPDVQPGDYQINVAYLANTDEGESFMFTIDTRMTETLDSDAEHLGGTAATFAIPTSGYVSRDSSHSYDWVIDWGDGSTPEVVSGISSDTSNGVPHTYAAPGEYQITIRSHGPVTSGWLNAFGFYNTFNDANAQTNKNMFKSIDSMLTDSMRTPGTTYRFAYMFYGTHNAVDVPLFLFNDIKTSYSENVSNMFNSTFSNYAVNSTSATIPAGLFNSIYTSSATDASNMFNSTFFNFARSSTTATIPDGLFSSIDVSGAANVSNLFRDTFFGHAGASTVGTIPADLFASIQLADGANASDMFGGTFYAYASNSTSGTIPSGLLSTIDTTRASSIVGMFSGTFSNYATASSSGTIPADLFASIHTDNITDTSYLFNGTFSNFARDSNTSIPAGLFSAINTDRATNMPSTFAGTFSNFANNSTVATIPSGLFDAVNTASAGNLANTFRDTFSNYAGLSTVATIPAGLFDTISTANATNTSGMYSGSFYFYGHVSPVATIPAGLFSRLDLGRASDTYEMFYRSFDSFAYEATAPTDINAIWGNANFASRVATDNVSSFFNSTFSNVTRLTGTAQTFINGKLGGITPASPAHTFATTAVDDYTTLDPNWK